ncbi:hypothetical protein IFM89_018082 [Coptis chinensis]|uniref:Uncharacterized protein n=1 Tax=Coptis chinensis TaxID=261450 RepID=A0A835ICH1_9MAGN|nr:hypothetical protein IFM89_018082 [Coptis chinensis]
MPKLEKWSSWNENGGREGILLPCLKKLNINNCPKLTRLLLSSSLECLYVGNCSEIVLRSLENLPCLSSLTISSFSEAVSFPERMLPNLTALQSLRIWSCEKLKILPEELGNLSSLKSFYISGCCELQCLPELTYLSKTNHHPDLLLSCRVSRNKLLPKIYYTRINHDNLTSNTIIPKTVAAPFMDIKPMYEILILGSCNGLICLSSIKSKLVTNRDHLMSLMTRQERDMYVLPIHDPIYVYNPITRENQELPCFEFCNVGKNVEQVVCGFGFDVVRREFKVVFVFFYKLDNENVFSEVGVYTLGTDTWRKLKVDVPHLVFKAEVAVSFEFANGSLHWIAEDVRSLVSKPFILSFNLVVEEFLVFPTPESVGLTRYYGPLEHCALGVLDKRLSLVDTSSGQFVDIWVVKDYDGEMCWNKQFSLEQNLICDSAIGLVRPIQVLKSGEILLFCGLTDLVAYNTESNQRRLLKLDRDSFRNLGTYFSL